MLSPFSGSVAYPPNTFKLLFKISDGDGKRKIAYVPACPTAMIYLSKYVRSLVSDVKGDEEGNIVIDASDFEEKDVRSIVATVNNIEQVILSTLARDDSETDLTSKRIPHGLIRFAHKFEMDLVFNLVKHAINLKTCIEEIIEMDSVCCDAEWAGDEVVETLIAELKEHGAAGSTGAADGKVQAVSQLSGPLLYKALTSRRVRLL